MQASEYRPDIDGLRAVAVVLVLLYHLDIGGGGFVGVDVFFVISGFLITRLITKEHRETGQFSFSRFYTRRARRLFPALFFTLAATFAVAIFVFAPLHLKHLGGAVIHAVTGTSNLYFWAESGYFDVASELKPLLHTWSLGVEEQFYLIWPAFIFFLLARGSNTRVVALTLLVGAVSLVLNDLFSSGSIASALFGGNAERYADPTAIFYLTPFRVFEFAIGAILVFMDRYPPAKASLLEFAYVVGLLMILYSAFTLTENVAFPSYHGLVPCIGTALAIYGGRTKYAPAILRSRTAVGIGLISYSLYLIHWPIIVFSKYTHGMLNAADKFSIVVLSVAIAWLMYRFVESPFRGPLISARRWSNGAFGLTCAMLAILLILPAAHTWANGGWEGRLAPETRRLALSASIRDSAFESECIYRIDEKPQPEAVDRRAIEGRFRACSRKFGAALIIIGDSHATDLFNAVAVLSDAKHIIGFTRGGCRPHAPMPGCQYAYFADFLERYTGRIGSILYKQSGEKFMVPNTDPPVNKKSVQAVVEYLSAIKGLGEVVWVGPHNEPNVAVPGMREVINWKRLGNQENFAIHAIDQYLERLLEGTDIPYVSSIKRVAFNFTNDFVVNGEFTYSDKNHWSAAGEVVFGRRLFNDPSLFNIVYSDSACHQESVHMCSKAGKPVRSQAAQ